MDFDGCTQRFGVGRNAEQAHAQPGARTGIGGGVAVNAAGTLIGLDHHIDVAVALDVKTGQSPPLAGVVDSTQGGLFGECAAAVVDEQPRRRGAELIRRAGHGPSVDVEQVQIAVQIEVGGAGAPAPGTVPNTGTFGVIDEATAAAGEVVRPDRICGP